LTAPGTGKYQDLSKQGTGKYQDLSKQRTGKYHDRSKQGTGKYQASVETGNRRYHGQTKNANLSGSRQSKVKTISEPIETRNRKEISESGIPREKCQHPDLDNTMHRTLRVSEQTKGTGYPDLDNIRKVHHQGPGICEKKDNIRHLANMYTELIQ
jgi:hypothetical protein